MAGDPPIWPWNWPFAPPFYQPTVWTQPIGIERNAKLEALYVEVSKFLDQSMFLVGAERMKELVKELKQE